MSVVDFILELEADQTLSRGEILSVVQDSYPGSNLAHDYDFTVMYKGYDAETRDVPRLALVLANTKLDEDSADREDVVNYLGQFHINVILEYAPRILVNYPELVYANVKKYPALLLDVFRLATREHLNTDKISWLLLEAALEDKEYDLVRSILMRAQAYIGMRDNVLALFLLDNEDLQLKRIIIDVYRGEDEMLLMVVNRISEEDSVDTKRALIGLVLNIADHEFAFQVLMNYARTREDREALLIIADYAMLLGFEQVAERIDKLL